MAIITMDILRAMGFSEEHARNVLKDYKPKDKENNNKTTESEAKTYGKRD